MTNNASPEFVMDILEENRYLSLATTDGDEPWVAPVEYIVDGDLNFYFISKTSSSHVNHIEQNPVVGVAIFDSTQPSLNGRGIQIRGSVEQYSENRNPFAIFDDRPDVHEELSEIDPNYSAYKIRPTQFYVPVHDERVEVKMDL